MMMPERDPPRHGPHSDVARRGSDPAGDSSRTAQKADDETEVHAVTVPKILTLPQGNSASGIDNQHWSTDGYPGVGARLRLFRRAMGLGSVEQAAKLINAERTRWQNWESGLSILPVVKAVELRHLYPALSLDWLYAGDSSGLTARTIDTLRAQALRDTEEEVARQVLARTR